jgi:lysozyme
MSNPWYDRVIGVDVSHWNGTIDWQILKEGGVEFVIAKASDGWRMRDEHDNYGPVNDPASYVDRTFAYNRQGAWDIDVPFLAYHYFRPDMPLDEINPQADRQFSAFKYALGPMLGLPSMV